MPAVAYSQSSRSSRGTSIAVLVIGVAIIGIGVHLVNGGEIPLPFTDQSLSLNAQEQGVVAKQGLEGHVNVPISGRAIDPYSKLVREDLIHPKTGTLATYPMRPEAIPENVITDMALIIGRVLSKEKPAGYVFTERDFLEKGTRAGITAGIPSGKRAFRCDASRINGLFGLRRGDRFDLVATLAIDDKPAQSQLESFGGTYGPAMMLEASFQNLTKRATVDVLVQGGVVVLPVGTRGVPVGSSTVVGGKATRTRPVEEIVIAIDPREIAPLTEALAIEAEVTAWARSGRPDDPADSITPSHEPASPFEGPEGTGMKLVETIGGAKRQMVPVPVVIEERG